MNVTGMGVAGGGMGGATGGVRAGPGGNSLSFHFLPVIFFYFYLNDLNNIITKYS